MPHLIQDVTERGLRVPVHLRDHPKGVTGIGRLVVLVAGNAGERYRALLGSDSACKIGPHLVEIREPSTAEEQDHFQRFGEGPWSLQLQGSEMRVLGVRLSVAGPN